MMRTSKTPCDATDAIRRQWAAHGRLTPIQAEHAEECAECSEAVGWLGAFADLANQPVGRGPAAGELWARAEVVRRFSAQPGSAADDRSRASWATLLGPLAGALVALAVVVVVSLALSTDAAVENSSRILGLVVGSAGVLVLGACSSLALLWNEL